MKYYVLGTVLKWRFNQNYTTQFIPSILADITQVTGSRVHCQHNEYEIGYVTFAKKNVTFAKKSNLCQKNVTFAKKKCKLCNKKKSM